MPVTSNDSSIVDLSKLGFSEVPASDTDLSELGFSEVKKKDGGSKLEVTAKGTLQKSVPTTSLSETQSKSQPVPDFGMASFSELAKGQQSTSDNTAATNVRDFEESVEERATREQRAADREAAKKRKKDALPIAIDDAAKRSLKIKGLDPNNKALLNKEKSKFALQIATGDADVGFDKETGKAGLVTTKGFLESFHDNMMEAINSKKDAREFKDMTVPERVEFAKKLQEKQPSAYIGNKPTPFGSVGGALGGVTPTLGLYAAGMAAGGLLESVAPVTGGLSTLALKPVMSFVMNEGDGANQKGMEGTLSRFSEIKRKNPEISDEDAMTQAGKGEDVDRLAGIAETALFSTVGGNAKLGKSATGNLLKGMARSGIDIGGKVAVTEGLKDIGHNIEGVTDKKVSDIAKDMAVAFGENAPMGAALHGVMAVVTGAAKLPGMLKSSLKYDVVTKMKPEEVKAALDENVKSGAITPEDAQKAVNELGEFNIALNKVPEGLSDEAAASVAGLMIKRDNLKKSMVGKDESANDIHNQEIESINNQIKEIYRTDKPLEHEINPATGETFKKPTFDNIAAMRVKNLADKISKGKVIEDAEDLQTQANFPQELEKQLQRLLKEEKSANKDKVKPNTEISDNVTDYLNEQSKEAEKTKVPVAKTETSITDEGINKVEQPPKEEPIQSTVVSEVRARTPEEVTRIQNDIQKRIDNNNEIIKVTGEDNAGKALGKLADILITKTDEANNAAKKIVKEKGFSPSSEEANKIYDEEFEKAGINKLNTLIDYLNDSNDAQTFKTTSLSKEAVDLKAEQENVPNQKVRVPSKSTTNKEVPDKPQSTVVSDNPFHGDNGNKVVDKKGEPLTVYHGSSEKFTEFDESKIGKTDRGFYGKGIYLSSEQSDAVNYAIDKEATNPYDRVKSFNVDIKNPLVVNLDTPEGKKLGISLTGKEIPKENDGVIVYENGKIKEVVVKSKSQLKSIKSKEIIQERTPEEIKKISRTPIDVENVDKKVSIPDLFEFEAGAKEVPLKRVTAIEARGELRQRLKDIENIIKCL